jgi:hypothetical protein
MTNVSRAASGSDVVVRLAHRMIGSKDAARSSKCNTLDAQAIPNPNPLPNRVNMNPMSRNTSQRVRAPQSLVDETLNEGLGS